jgi:hypothetical protein
MKHSDKVEILTQPHPIGYGFEFLFFAISKIGSDLGKAKVVPTHPIVMPNWMRKYLIRIM